MGLHLTGESVPEFLLCGSEKNIACTYPATHRYTTTTFDANLEYHADKLHWLDDEAFVMKYMTPERVKSNSISKRGRIGS